MFNGDRLRTARLIRDLTQHQLADKLGISTSLIAKYETKAITKPKFETLVQLAEALDVSIDYLLERDDYIRIPNVYGFNDLAKVPVYGTVPAGKPIEALEVDQGYIGLERDRFRGDKQYIGLKVKGDSMYPYYMDGDTIIVELTSDFNSGDDVVVFVGYDYGATLKRIHKKDDYIELEPINKEYPVKKYGREDLPVRVLGVVRELRRTV